MELRIDPQLISILLGNVQTFEDAKRFAFISGGMFVFLTVIYVVGTKFGSVPTKLGAAHGRVRALKRMCVIFLLLSLSGFIVMVATS
jgi:hypothetical protein